MQQGKNNQHTCCVAYKEGIDLYCQDNLALRRVFAIGFFHGQAEKVYLGACKAAMFRPNLNRNPWVRKAITEVATRYKLVVIPLAYENITELWVTKLDHAAEVEAIAGFPVNSAEWHQTRGLLCGVPENKLDSSFHLRKGYDKYPDDKY